VRRAGWLTGLLLLAGLIAVVQHFGEGRHFVALALHADPAWLAAAALLQGATYVCAATVWQRALRAGGIAETPWGLVPLGLAKLFADQALPSAGLSGTLLVVRALTRRGVPRPAAVAAMLAGLVSFYLAYALALGGALAILWWRGEVSRALVALAFVFALLASGVPLAILWLRGRSTARLPRALLRVPGAREVLGAIEEAPRGAIFGGRLALETIGLQLCVFALDAGTLAAMLRAVASPLDLAVAFASFVIASVVATLAWVPGGLGTFEATCVAMLRVHGAELGAALSAVLLLRGFTFWLPMAPGLWIARRQLAEDGRHRRPA
jgi:glycosyltransferase 2 family protein